MYMLNFSMDGRDLHPDHVAENLQHNDIESLVEFTLECVFGIENAIQEHDEDDPDTGRVFSMAKYLKPIATSWGSGRLYDAQPPAFGNPVTALLSYDNPVVLQPPRRA